MELPAPESGQILVKTTEAVMTITLNRPDKLNALTGAMYQDLVNLLALAENMAFIFKVGFNQGPEFHRELRENVRRE